MTNPTTSEAEENWDKYLTCGKEIQGAEYCTDCQEDIDTREKPTTSEEMPKLATPADFLVDELYVAKKFSTDAMTTSALGRAIETIRSLESQLATVTGEHGTMREMLEEIKGGLAQLPSEYAVILSKLIQKLLSSIPSR